MKWGTWLFSRLWDVEAKHPDLRKNTQICVSMSFSRWIYLRKSKITYIEPEQWGRETIKSCVVMTDFSKI
jgi:hypothetical protein